MVVLQLLTSENSYTRYENTDLSESSIVPEKVNTIYEDDNETIWVSSVKGVSKFLNGNFKSFITIHH